jgi:hypothetical protein
LLASATTIPVLSVGLERATSMVRRPIPFGAGLLARGGLLCGAWWSRGLLTCVPRAATAAFVIVPVIKRRVRLSPSTPHSVTKGDERLEEGQASSYQPSREKGDIEPRGNLLGAILCVPVVLLIVTGVALPVFAYTGIQPQILGAVSSFIVGVVIALDARRKGASSAWGIGVFLAMIIFLPIYVYKRPKFAWRLAYGYRPPIILKEKMAKKPCPNCGGPVAVDDESCYFCHTPLR